MSQGFYAENIAPEFFPKVTFWCSGCNAEPATIEIEAQFNGEWVPIMIGEQCLTRAAEQGKME